jgi:hypothetical protein
MRAGDAFRSPAVRLSAAALLAAFAIAGRSLVHALRATPIPAVPPALLASTDQLRRAPLPAPADIQAAVERDVFAPDRSAPSTPYRLPGERDDSDTPAVEPVKPLVLGTAVATDGRSFATVQLGDGSPVLVHVGEKIGDWTVKAIGRGKVTLVTAGGSRAELSVTKPGT